MQICAHTGNRKINSKAAHILSFMQFLGSSTWWEPLAMQSETLGDWWNSWCCSAVFAKAFSFCQTRRTARSITAHVAPLLIARAVLCPELTACLRRGIGCPAPTNPPHIWCTTPWSLQKEGTQCLQSVWCRSVPPPKGSSVLRHNPTSLSHKLTSTGRRPISCLAWLALLALTYAALRATNSNDQARTLPHFTVMLPQLILQTPSALCKFQTKKVSKCGFKGDDSPLIPQTVCPHWGVQAALRNFEAKKVSKCRFNSWKHDKNSNQIGQIGMDSVCSSCFSCATLLQRWN